MSNDENNIVHFPQTARTTPGRFVIPGRIRDARRALRWSQQQLADAIGKTRQLISAYESAKKAPEPETFALLASVLQQPAHYFTVADKPTFGNITPHFFRKRGPDTDRRNEACAVLGVWFAQILVEERGVGARNGAKQPAPTETCRPVPGTANAIIAPTRPDYRERCRCWDDPGRVWW